jgi:hypothetical protein
MVPWYDEEIKLAGKERRKAERKWRTTKKTADLKKFKSLKNHCTKLMRKAKCSFFSDFVKENSNNQGAFFKAIKGMLAGKNAISFPGRNETALVNELGKYFVQKISNIHSETNKGISSNNDGHVDPPSDDNEEYPGDVSHFDAFELLSDDDVRKLVVDSHKISCYLDPVPTDFLVKCLDVLLPVITKIINISLETGYFPRDWKEDIILSILKKVWVGVRF